MSILVPPIKSQGIKTKLVEWIERLLPEQMEGRWIEPFMGTGVVGFNVSNRQATMCDSNPHLVNFYRALASNEITAMVVREYLESEGRQLSHDGEIHYYRIRERFNANQDPLDFLFLNRAGFNGMIRFNRKGEFNIPFCRKPGRFSKAYISRIVNQVQAVEELLSSGRFQFKCQSFEETISLADSDDFIYCDPPYIGRHVDYFSQWNETSECKLYELLSQSGAHFALSTWHHNQFRSNDFIDSLWSEFEITTREHYYHVGGFEKNRNSMVEALVTNFKPTQAITERKKCEIDDGSYRCL